LKKDAAASITANTIATTTLAINAIPIVAVMLTNILTIVLKPHLCREQRRHAVKDRSPAVIDSKSHRDEARRRNATAEDRVEVASIDA
jgi:hypothetical protein